MRHTAEIWMEILLHCDPAHLKKEKCASRYLEPPLILLGLLLGNLGRLLPAPLFNSLHLSLLKRLSRREKKSLHLQTQSPPLSSIEIGSFPLHPMTQERIQQLHKLHRELQELKNRPPAWLLLSSHPPVVGALRPLNLELFGLGLEILQRVQAPQHPMRLVAAVDDYALDSLGRLEAPLYAGLMQSAHLAMDRQPSRRNPCSRCLLSPSHPRHIAWKILKALKAGEAVLSYLPGGAPPTARLLYGLKEFVISLRKTQAPQVPSAAALFQSLRAEASFQDFLDLYSLQEKPKNPWLWITAWILHRAGPDVARTGRATPSLLGALEILSSHLGLSAQKREFLKQTLETELLRPMPRRLRFFQTLLKRLLSKGIGVLLVPLSHGTEKNPQLQLLPAIALTGRLREDSAEALQFFEGRTQRECLPLPRLAQTLFP
ncbi:MAG: hypothetical protein HY402_05095 [Elusimicrobia bacterium]|nr:hypothetical protein [Elusimicrobiota bacterium]